MWAELFQRHRICFGHLSSIIDTYVLIQSGRAKHILICRIGINAVDGCLFPILVLHQQFGLLGLSDINEVHGPILSA